MDLNGLGKHVVPGQQGASFLPQINILALDILYLAELSTDGFRMD
jgi:hypothetical protein